MPGDMLEDFEEFALRVRDGRVQVLDQRLLPGREVWLEVGSLDEIYEYVVTLAVRGAPMIGCAVALSLAQWRFENPDADLRARIEFLRGCRPTAVNLNYCCDTIAQVNIPEPDYSPANIARLALGLIRDEKKMYQKIADYGVSILGDEECILTHCNTGSLAAPGIGTALGIIKEAHRRGKKVHVYVDETRPLLQGARLTAYELHRENIPYTIICDNMAAHLMKKKKIDRILVGADRIAMNGDFANKIGTYSLAIVASYHNVPFHAVAPISTLDIHCKTGDDIQIEQRSENEVLGASGINWSPNGACAYNPAFDVTPINLTTSIILDRGIFTKDSIERGILHKI